MILAVLAYEILYFQKWFKSDHVVALNSLSTYAGVCHNFSTFVVKIEIYPNLALRRYIWIAIAPRVKD